MKRIHLTTLTLIAAAGSAAAADLPVKAVPTEYVKVCAAYGAGFYYIPGTDTCIKIGGYVRFDGYWNSVATFTPLINSTVAAAFNGAGAGAFGYPFRDGDDNQLAVRSRAVLDFDARAQTEYGTLRSYIRTGMSWDSQAGTGAGPGTVLYFERAFVQWAGFTFGYVQSFFDTAYSYMYTTPFAGSNKWTTALAYTTNLGSGVTATVSLEDAANRVTGVQMTGTTAQPLYDISSSAVGLSYSDYRGGQVLPDLVANIRVDQDWGSAMLSGAMHQVEVVGPAYTGFYPGLSSTGSWGWALGAGVEVRLPWLATGDSLAIQANYAQGGVAYLGMSAQAQAQAAGIGTLELHQVGQKLSATGAFYPAADAVAVDSSGNFSLTSGWALQGQLRHYWTPAVRSAAYAGFVAYTVPQNVVAAQDFNVWQVGANTIWSPVRNLDIGAELLYTRVDGSVPLGNYSAINSNGALIASLVGGSTDIWSGGIRVQRNF